MAMAEQKATTGRLNTDQDVDPESGESQKAMRETNSQEGQREQARPASKHENPRDVDGKELSAKENTVSEKEEQAEEFVRKEASDDVVDEDHPPIKVRETITKPKMRHYLRKPQK